MSRKYKFHDQDKLYFISFAKVHWIDVFVREEYNQIIIDSWKHCQQATAIKNNNAESRKEWIIWMMERAGKKNGNNKDWQFWQQHNNPIEIKDQEMFDNTLQYIHDNPVAAGFVTRPEDWKYSSAGDFCGKKGLVELSYS